MSPTLYAAGTDVPVERSKLELERILRKFGASQYGTASDDAGGKAIVYFRMHDRSIRLQVPLPKVDDFKLRANSSWRHRTDLEKRRAWEQACRVRWRGLILVIKAKLQLVELGLSTVEREFLADITLPDGRSVAELFKPVLEQAYATGRMPMLGTGSEADR